MATSEVLLIEPVEGLGSEGDQVKVKAGFARNFLLPTKKAIPVTRANRKQIEALKVRRAQREAQNLADAKAQAAKLAETQIGIAVKTGEAGRMFGAVTSIHIHEKLSEAGYDIDRKKIHLAQPIKELGQHVFTVKVHAEVEVEMKIDVVSENPIVEPEEGAGEEADDSSDKE